MKAIKNNIGYFFSAIIFLGSYTFIINTLGDSIPYWPLNWNDVIWVLSLFFPFTAFLYVIFKLRVRYSDISDVLPREEIHRVIFPSDSNTNSLEQFNSYMRNRFNEYYNPTELCLFSLLSATVTFLAGYLVLNQCNIKNIAVDFSSCSVWVMPVSSGVVGAISGTMVYVLKKYRTFDIYPGTYLQTSVAIIVGGLSSSFFTVLWPAQYVTFLGFALGFLLATNINFLSKLLRQRFAKLTDTPITDEIPTNLNKVIMNSEAIESLNDSSIFSIAEVLEVNPIRLYLNISQPITVVNGWLDQALLAYYFEEKIQPLNNIGIIRFTQLLELVVSSWDKNQKTINWANNVSIINSQVDDSIIASSVKNIVRAKTHHRLLGLLSNNYKNTFFL